MKITIENTTEIVTLQIDGKDVPARVWQGQTDSGIPVHCFITRIVPEVPNSHPHVEALLSDFEHELDRCEDPRPDVLNAIPLRLIL